MQYYEDRSQRQSQPIIINKDDNFETLLVKIMRTPKCQIIYTKININSKTPSKYSWRESHV